MLPHAFHVYRAGSGLCDVPIARTGESYRVCVYLCVIGCHNYPLQLQMERHKRLEYKKKYVTLGGNTT